LLPDDGFAGKRALYFGDHFFVKADHGWLELVYVSEIDHHGGAKPFTLSLDMLAGVNAEARKLFSNSGLGLRAMSWQPVLRAASAKPRHLLDQTRSAYAKAPATLRLRRDEPMRPPPPQ